MGLLKSLQKGLGNIVDKTFDFLGAHTGEIASTAGALMDIAQGFYSSHQMQKAAASRNRMQLGMQSYYNDLARADAANAHQIEMADLRKAGLNPILTATGGNGAVALQGGAGSLLPTFSEGSARAFAGIGRTASKLVAGMLTEELIGKKLENEQLRKENAILGDERDLSHDMTRLQRITTAAKLSALDRDGELNISVGDGVSPFHFYKGRTFQDLEQAFSNSAEKQRMVESYEHQIFEDVKSALDSVPGKKLFDRLLPGKTKGKSRGRR